MCGEDFHWASGELGVFLEGSDPGTQAGVAVALEAVELFGMMWIFLVVVELECRGFLRG